MVVRTIRIVDRHCLRDADQVLKGIAVATHIRIIRGKVGDASLLRLAGCQVDTHGQVAIQIPFKIDTSAITLEACVHQDTVLIGEVATDQIACALISPADAQLVILCGCGAQGSTLPIITLSPGSHNLRGQPAIGNLRRSSDLQIEISPFASVEQIQLFRYLLPTNRILIFYARTPLLATLGRDNDHTIGTPATVDRRSRDIFQHLYALYIIWINR